MMKKMSLRKSKNFIFMNNFIVDLPTPPNLNFWWNMGSLTGAALSLQILTGILLTMHYVPEASLAFFKITTMEINNFEGATLRGLHALGASTMFIFIFLHMFRSLFYGSYLMNKVTWISGVTLFILTMMTAFLGYVLPWGQMSFWAATVITNMLSAIPFVGHSLVIWIWGGFSVGGATLNRFYTFHFLLPFMLLAITILHLLFLHESGSNNPLGVISTPSKKSFHSYFTWKDFFGLFLPLSCLFFLTFSKPDVLTDVANFIEANPLSTPAHIMPEWYFLFAYGILRSVPNKLGGVMALIGSVAILYLLGVGQSKFYFIKKSFQGVWANLIASNFIVLSFIGSQLVEQPYILIGQIFSVSYFLLFAMLFLMK
uniref:Cytochrome b n=1 Tax=Gordionus wolterstorffii TaxID=190562 RepID=A0A514ABX8_9BILA|nr:cytochrome b [Gordionus wolterstorffii]